MYDQLSAQEQKAAINAFNDPSQTQANGIRLVGHKFFTLQANERSVYGKKGVYCFHCLYNGAAHQLLFKGDGCVLVKTKQAVLVAEYVFPVQAPEATHVVESLADYLINAGY